jgi:hypothetical protein
MPTGSLCAERNVIGTALSSDLSLKRQDLKAIAVLSVSLKQEFGSDESSSFKLPQKNPSISKQQDSELVESPSSQKSGNAKAHVTYENDVKNGSAGQPSSPSRQRMVRVYSSLSSPKSAALLNDQGSSQFALPPAVETTASLRFPDRKFALFRETL